MINHLDYDRREHGPKPSQTKPSVEVALEYSVDLTIAKRIREGLREKQEAEAFAEAEKRMRGTV